MGGSEEIRADWNRKWSRNVKIVAPKDPKSVAEETASVWCSSLSSTFSNEWISNGHCSVRFWRDGSTTFSARGQGVVGLILWHLELWPVALMEDGNLETWKFNEIQSLL